MALGKNFDDWNELKKKLEGKVERKAFKERDILFISFGINVGSEQNGYQGMFLRPVLVFKKVNSKLFIGIPLTTKVKFGKEYYKFVFKNKISVALLSQLRTFDAKRILYFYGRVNDNIFYKIKKRLFNFLK